MTRLDTKKVSLTAVLSALTIVVAYSKGLSVPFFPGLIEFMTVLIFISGFHCGSIVGCFVGFISLTMYMLIPAPFAQPGAWIFTISPMLLLLMGALGALFGIVGGLMRRMRGNARIGQRFVFEMALIGLTLTFAYDILSSVAFYLAYPIYPSILDAIYLTFVPLYYVYPPIIHTVTNTIVFAIIAPTLVRTLRSFQM